MTDDNWREVKASELEVRYAAAERIAEIGVNVRTARAVAALIAADLAEKTTTKKSQTIARRNASVLADWRAGLPKKANCAKHRISQATYYNILMQRNG
jgi:uncharacterized protein YjiK